MILFREKKRHVLRRVAGRVPSGNESGAKLEDVSIDDSLMFETVARASFVTEVYFRGLGTRTKFTRTTDEIDMDVRFKNMRNRYLFLESELQVAIHIRARIEHRGYSRGIITDQVGKLGDTFGLNSFKNECHTNSF